MLVVSCLLLTACCILFTFFCILPVVNCLQRNSFFFHTNESVYTSSFSSYFSPHMFLNVHSEQEAVDSAHQKLYSNRLNVPK